MPVAAFTNLSNFVTTNIGSMRNQRHRDEPRCPGAAGRHERGLTWQADFTAAHNTNELLTITPFGGSSLEDPDRRRLRRRGHQIQVLAPGEPINSFYVYEHIRENGQPIYRDVNGDRVDGLPDGTINEQDLYVDQNGDGIINQDDLRPFHDPAPNWILGHSSYLALGQASISASPSGRTWATTSTTTWRPPTATTASSPQGSPYNLHTSVLETGFATQQLQSDFYVEDASFLRMDNLTLGYSFNLRGQPARVFGTVQNAVHRHRLQRRGSEREHHAGQPVASRLPLNGIDNNIYPRSRTFSGGLSLRL